MDYLTMDENVCPVCGKVFNTVNGREWGWTYKGSKYCTYHCMRHVEIRHRVAMGWQKNPMGKSMRDLSDEAAKIAAKLIRLRNLRSAYGELAEAVMQEDSALAALTKRVGQMGNRAHEEWSGYFARLDENKRRLATAVFIEAQPLEKVALDMDIDIDLLQVKLGILYEALAKVCV